MGEVLAAGIFGVVGVLVGGVITAGFEMLRERRATRRGRLTAARLISAELSHAHDAIGRAVENNAWWQDPIPTDAWRERADALIADVEVTDWRDVADAFRAIARANINAHAPTFLPIEAERQLGGAQSEIKAAIDIVNRYA
jgi:hypothetical protein